MKSSSKESSRKFLASRSRMRRCLVVSDAEGRDKDGVDGIAEELSLQYRPSLLGEAV